MDSPAGKQRPLTQVDCRPPSHDNPASVRGDSLATGAAGIALLYIEQARAGIGRWSTVQEWASIMTRGAVTANPDVSSLFRGAPAVAFTLHAAGQPAYATALDTLDGHITAIIRHRLEQAHERIDCGRPPMAAEFDLISGLTGLGVYLLHRHGGGDLLWNVLVYLVRLTEPLKANGEVLPGWWCGESSNDQSPRRFPGGHGNLGVAHGIAGPLALLSTALRRGVTVSGQAEAIDRICVWLDQWRCGSGPRAWWPARISLAEWRTGVVRQPGPQRPSWCYGTPGLARAQQVAALVLADPQRRQRAEQALAGCLTDEGQLARLRDSSLCHGWAGLVQAAWRAAFDAGSDSELAAHLPQLCARMSQHLYRHGLPAHDGLLEGRAGLRLAQLTTTANGPPITRWDACLLLDG